MATVMLKIFFPGQEAISTQACVPFTGQASVTEGILDWGSAFSTAITCACIHVGTLYISFCYYVLNHLHNMYSLLLYSVLITKTLCFGCVRYRVPVRAGTVAHSPIKYALGQTGVTG
jgi:hypothetical protein